MATHSSILAWRILRTEESGGLRYMGLQRVKHDLVFVLSILMVMFSIDELDTVQV